jgi:hypothetical protein
MNFINVLSTFFFKWNSVKTIAAQNVRDKIKRLVNHYKNLKKNKNTRNKCQIENEQIFRNQLAHIFDISGSKLLNLTHNYEAKIWHDQNIDMKARKRKIEETYKEYSSENESDSDIANDDDHDDLNFSPCIKNKKTQRTVNRKLKF